MRPTQWSALDLNLLRLADVLLEQQNVSATADLVHLSQPAVSRALGRLRHQLGDPLLVRQGHAMVLTPFAQHLRPRLRGALRELERTVDEPQHFSAKDAEGRFVIATADYADVVFLSRAAAQLATDAPGVELVVRPYREPFEPMLEAHDVDLVIGPRASERSWIHSQLLFVSAWVCVARRGHAWLRRPGLDAFCTAEHLQISPQGDGPARVDLALSRLGKQRRVRLRVPTFAGALSIAAQSQLLLVAPEVLARAALRILPLAQKPLPFSLPNEEVYLSWHAANDTDPRFRWLLQLVRRVVDAASES